MPLKETSYLTDEFSIADFAGMANYIGNYLSGGRHAGGGGQTQEPLFTFRRRATMMPHTDGETSIPPASKPVRNQTMAKKAKVKSAAKKKPVAKKKKK